MSKIIFEKFYLPFFTEMRKMTKCEILCFSWLALHADARGNIILLSPELYQRLLDYVGVKKATMYNIFSKLEKRGMLDKHGDVVIINSQYANKHRKIYPEVTLYNWSLTQLDF